MTSCCCFVESRVGAFATALRLASCRLRIEPNSELTARQSRFCITITKRQITIIHHSQIRFVCSLFIRGERGEWVMGLASAASGDDETAEPHTISRVVRRVSYCCLRQREFSGKCLLNLLGVCHCQGVPVCLVFLANGNSRGRQKKGKRWRRC